MARALRKHWNVPRGPIMNVIELLERNNIIIQYFDFESDRLDGFFMPLPHGVVSIALNSNAAFSPDRQWHSCIHELAHCVLAHYESFPDEDCEKEAERFTAEFLAPEADVLADLQNRCLYLS